MIHIGKLIQQKLNESGTSASWLAEQLECPSSEVIKILENRSIETDHLLRISSVLGYNFFQDYSHLLAQMKTEN